MSAFIIPLRNPQKASHFTYLGRENDPEALLSHLQEKTSDLRRGDTVEQFIFDGEKLVPLADDVLGWGKEVPKEFPAITEFPLRYWDQSAHLSLARFDHTPYGDQILANLSNEPIFGPMKAFSYEPPRNYWWGSFQVVKPEAKPELKRDEANIITSDASQYTVDYQPVTYYLLVDTDQNPREFLRGLFQREAYMVPFQYMPERFFRSNRELEALKDYILYLPETSLWRSFPSSGGMMGIREEIPPTRSGSIMVGGPKIPGLNRSQEISPDRRYEGEAVIRESYMGKRSSYAPRMPFNLDFDGDEGEYEYSPPEIESPEEVKELLTARNRLMGGPSQNISRPVYSPQWNQDYPPSPEPSSPHVEEVD